MRDVRLRIIESFDGPSIQTELLVPWKHHGLVQRAREAGTVLEEHHEEEGTRLVLRAPQSVLDRLRAAMAG